MKFKNKFINTILIILTIISICLALRLNSLYEKCRKKTPPASTQVVENSDPLVNHNYTGKPILKVKCLNDGNTAYNLIKYALRNDYDVFLSDKNYDIILDGTRYKGTPDDIKNDKAIKISYTWEATRPFLEVYDLSMGFDFINHPKYLRLPLQYIFYTDKMNTEYQREQKCNPNKKYFACFMVSNGNWNNGIHPVNKMPMDGCDARNRIFHKLSLYKHVESGGRYLNNTGSPIPRGEETDKWLSECKFMIAYENQTYDGWITEKPFQAYFGGAIPITYGQRKAFEEDINMKSVIFAQDFKSEEELVEYIKKVDNDDKLYCDIWNQKMLVNPDKDYEIIVAQLRDKLVKIIDLKLNNK